MEKMLRMEAAGSTFVDWPREVAGYPVREAIAADTFDNIGLRARWHLMEPGRSIFDPSEPSIPGITSWAAAR